MKTCRIVLLLFCIFQSLSFCKNVDSLKQLLDNSGRDKRVDILIKIAENIKGSEPGKALLYINEALALLEINPDDKQQAEAEYQKGWIYYFMNKKDSAEYFADLTGEISEKAGYQKGKVMSAFLKARILRDKDLYDDALKFLETAKNYNTKVKDSRLNIKIINETGSVLKRLSRFDDALSEHKKALHLLNEFHDEEELSATHSYLGILYNIIGDFDEALTHYHKALDLNKELNNKRGIAAAVHNIGILYQKINKYEQALEYFTLAETYWNELNNQNNLAATFNSIGAVLELQNKPNEALSYYMRALEIWEKTGHNSSISIALNNTASVHGTLGNYKEAKKYIQQAINIREEIGDKNGYSSSLLILSEIYFKLGLPDSAIAAGKTALKTAEEAGSLTTIRQAHHVLANLYEENGLFKEALNEFRNFKIIHDSIFNSESQQVIAEMQEKYKTEEQKQKIELLQKENEIQSLYRIILIAGFIVLVFFLALLFNRYRLSKKYLLEHQHAQIALQKLHESEVESVNLRIAAAESKAALLQSEYEQKKKELDAARDLQLSMLPLKLPEHPDIIISAAMKTANEVGGDYYDFYSENEKLTIAIGDATGHGAQAGLIVTAVKSLFNLLSAEENITDILQRSTNAVKKMQFSNLFMALAILRLCDHRLELAGAGMPPAYIYRAATEEIEIIELKGLPVGIISTFKYEKKIVNLFKDDVVLLMTDGFPELFNSKKETLGFEKIPELLKESGEKSPEEIIKFFTDKAEKWTDGEKQQDDITFVVFKMTS